MSVYFIFQWPYLIAVSSVHYFNLDFSPPPDHRHRRQMHISPRPFLFVFLLLILSSSLSYSLPISSYHSVLSLSQSLAYRVATLRSLRGDHEGAERARLVGRNLEWGMFYKFAWNMSWDYLKNYAWRSTVSFETLSSLLSDMNELLDAVGEFNRLRSNAERVAWFSRHYQSALRVSKSLFGRLLDVFRRPGPLRELMETLQKEVVEGDLLRDCLELSGNDLKDLIRVVKDIVLQYSSASTRTDL